MKYELEEGTTPSGRDLRFGFDPLEFPGFSWRGYAQMTPLQVRGPASPCASGALSPKPTPGLFSSWKIRTSVLGLGRGWILAGKHACQLHSFLLVYLVPKSEEGITENGAYFWRCFVGSFPTRLGCV